jgi:hypothetical protein
MVQRVKRKLDDALGYVSIRKFDCELNFTELVVRQYLGTTNANGNVGDYIIVLDNGDLDSQAPDNFATYYDLVSP